MLHLWSKVAVCHSIKVSRLQGHSIFNSQQGMTNFQGKRMTGSKVGFILLLIICHSLREAFLRSVYSVIDQQGVTKTALQQVEPIRLTLLFSPRRDMQYPMYTHSGGSIFSLAKALSSPRILLYSGRLTMRVLPFFIHLCDLCAFARGSSSLGLIRYSSAS